MSRIVCLNGEFLPLSEARVSVLDRGFTFGDGVYEVIPVFAGNIFRIDEHLDRLDNSLTGLNITINYQRNELKNILRELVRRNPAAGDQQLYMQITRGVTDRDHFYDEHVTPTFFAMCKPASGKDFSKGVSVITHEDIRWQYCHIKATALLASVLLKKLAKDSNCHEAILIRNGMVTEGASSNVFIVSDSVIKTPKKDHNVLPGITRDLMIELLLQTGCACRETDITERELQLADEIWITAATIGVVPVVRLNGKNVGDGKPGRNWKKAREVYEAYKVNGPHTKSMGSDSIDTTLSFTS